MRDQELVNALRCVSSAGGPMEVRENCPFYKTEPVPEDLVKEVGVKDWSSCDVDAVGFAAADRIANMNTHILALQKEIENLRGQVPRWIPVMERRPEQDGKYLCVYSFRTMDDSPARMSFPSVLDYYATDPVPHFQHEGVNEMHVTHWMPLSLPIPIEPIYG